MRKTKDETTTKRQSRSRAKPKTAVMTRRTGVNISITSPANIKVTGSKVVENIRSAKLPSEGFVETGTINDGEIVAITNPRIIKLALTQTPSRRTRLVQRSAV